MTWTTKETFGSYSSVRANATENKIMKTLAQCFNEEAQRNGTGSPFRTLSAAGGTNDKEATGDRRLQIMNDCGRLGKILRDPVTGRQLTSNDIMSMPLDDLEALFKKTPADSSLAHPEGDGNFVRKSEGVGDGTQPVALLAAVFNAENACTKLLSARFDNGRDAAEDTLRFKTIRSFLTENRLPVKADGFTTFSERELIEMPLATLRMLAVNTRKTIRFL
jgi:hypothetical protein